MLQRLIVSNFAIIENIDISFKDGLTVLTGETGAGKSLIIDSLSLLLGERAQLEMIRTGSDKAEITGYFSVNNAGQPDAGRGGPAAGGEVYTGALAADAGLAVGQVGLRQVTDLLYHHAMLVGAGTDATRLRHAVYLSL